MNMPEQRHAIIVVDLAFGDCGKGTLVDFLTRHHGAHTVVRFNGGPQAGHNVVTTDGRHHTFAQFGSGTFVPEVRTLLSRFMLIEPYALFKEEAHLRENGITDAMERLLIDGDCMVITPPHQAANRLRELARGKDAHGTCGMGIGETMQDSINDPELTLRFSDLGDADLVARRLVGFQQLKAHQLGDSITALQDNPAAQPSIAVLLESDWLDTAIETYRELARLVQKPDTASLFNSPGTIIFEGAQGVLLDQTWGFHPHTTWSDTTFTNAETVLRSAGFHGQQTRMGVLRTYFTRHGAGPFPTEDSSLRQRLPEPHNSDAGWQGQFRVGIFDLPSVRYALMAVKGVDELAITHIDRLPLLPDRICTSYGPRASPVYSPQSTDPEAFLDRISREVSTPIRLVSFGPTAAEKPLLR
jgi:adenylosuccinate synthase